METAIIILAILAGVIGLAGSILPGLPGTPVSWVGMLLLYIWGTGTNGAGDPMSLTTLIVWGVVVVIVSVIDYVVPMYFTKLTGGSKYADVLLEVVITSPRLDLTSRFFIFHWCS